MSPNYMAVRLLTTSHVISTGRRGEQTKLRLVPSEVGKDLSHDRVMSIAIVLATFVSLLFVGVADLSQMQATHMKSKWYDRIRVLIYTCAIDDGNPSCNGSEANIEQVSQVKAKLKSPEMQPYVKGVYEESKEEAYENLEGLYGDSTIGWWTSAGMMQVSFRVKLIGPEQYSIIREEFSGVAGVPEVRDQREIVEPPLRAIDAARLLVLGLGAMMIVVAILFISTAIRLSAMSREQGTQIMRYVGASNLLIQTPSMIEGALAAVTGALFAVTSLSTFAVFLIQGWLQPAFQWTHLIGVREVWIMTPLLTLAAVLLALIASTVSFAKYTKM